MCGIAGLYTKSATLREHLGAHLADMLEQLSDRGPDSAGVAFYRDPAPPGWCKVSLALASATPDWEAVRAELEVEFGEASAPQRARDARGVRDRRRGRRGAGVAARAPSRAHADERRTLDRDLQGGRSADAVRRAVQAGARSPAATRSATPAWRPRAGSPPSTRTRSPPGSTCAWSTTGRCRTTTGCAACSLARASAFRTDNDSEVAAGYLTWRLREGATLEQALEGCLDDLDGFYTFAVGTADGFAVLRDPIACKPAVMAETDEWVAMASEYRAIAVLPGRRGRRHVGARARPGLQLGHRVAGRVI